MPETPEQAKPRRLRAATKIPSKTVQDLADEFHSLIGYCIAEWAKVDEELFRICWVCLGSYRERAALIYYRTPTLDARLTLVDQLTSLVLPPKERAGAHDHPDVILWRDIAGNFRELLHPRRRIAHQPVRGGTEYFRAGQSQAGSPLSFFLPFGIYVSEAEQLRHKAQEPPLTKKNLQQHLRSLTALTSRLHDFCFDNILMHASASLPPDYKP
jgi:hypothetical protein